MTRILAIADQVHEPLYDAVTDQPQVDVIVSCGDLPFDYLENLVTLAGRPLVYVPDNHDPNVSPRDTAWEMLSVENPIPGPQGCENADGRIVHAAGIAIAGLGGSLRYKVGPNQYSQRKMRWRALRLEVRARLRRERIEVFLAHAQALGCGDGEDWPHRGFEAFHRLIRVLRPQLFIHGHLHPYGRPHADRRLGQTQIVNAVPYRLLEI